MTAADLEERCTWIADELHRMSKKGALVQLSGGIDSTVVVHLCARALGPDRTTALYLPDRSTGPETRRFVEEAVAGAGVELVERNIAEVLDAQLPPEAITAILRRYAPDYDPDRHAYAVNASQRMARRLGALVYQVSIGPRHGAPERTLKMSVEDLRAIIAYQNRKQRTRMLFAYAEAEARNLAVVGASNGDELRTGFVVKYGDDAADICAIGDLPKHGVYDLARRLGVPASIIARPPTTDTYALTQTQEDYYYALPAEILTELVAMSEHDLQDGTRLEQIAGSAPGWNTAALRQMATGLRATLRYQQTRSRTMA